MAIAVDNLSTGEDEDEEGGKEEEGAETVSIIKKRGKIQNDICVYIFCERRQPKLKTKYECPLLSVLMRLASSLICNTVIY